MKIYLPLFESQPVVVKYDTETKSESIYPKGICSSAFMRMWEKGYTGKSIIISILDTGIDDKHPDLNNKIIGKVNFTESSIPEDHGTHVAGIIGAKGKIYGGAPNCKLLDCKILSSKGGNLKNLLNGIKWSISKKANIINMSIGSTSLSKLELELLKASITNAWNNGCLCIAASGNDGTSTGTPDPYAYPASLKSVISVASCSVGNNLNDIKLSKFSNENDGVDLCACGFEVLSCVTGGKYAMYNGTSMATPHVTAFAALLAEQIKQKGYTGAKFCEEMTKLLKLNVYQQSYMRKISYGNGFIRFSPFEKPYIPSNSTFLYKGVLLGYYVSNDHGEIKIEFTKKRKNTEGIAKMLNISGQLVNYST